MPAQPGVILDTISFYDREVPDHIPWGGKQMLAIHRQLGGRRVVDAMGPDPHPIKWSGKFLSFGSGAGSLSNTDAAVRARAVDTLRQSGRQVWLYWGTFAYLVIVSDFVADYKHEWVIPYTVTCEVISDGPAQAGLLTLNQAVSLDLIQINAITSASPGIPAISGALTITPAMTQALNSAVQVVTAAGPSLDNLSLAQLQPVVSAFQAAYQTFAAGSGTPAGINLDAITGASTLDGISTFVAETNDIAHQSDVELAMAYLGRILGNLTTQPGG